MIQPRKPSPQVDVQKAARYAIIINALQIGMLVTFVALIMFTDIEENSLRMLRFMAVVTALTASWGAVVDIRQAMRVNRRTKTINDLTTTNSMMEDLNHTLRAQRHDFLNHLQVVYSLLEMQEYQEATGYLETVYGQIQSVSAVLRTRSAAVNALLQVKAAACKDQGVNLVLDITTTLEGMAMPAWEVCCVLSNLLDNAMDAALMAKQPTVRLAMTETLRHFLFTVHNNGQAISQDLAPHIFQPGVSSKGEGRGMGLAIAKHTLEEYGGKIQLHPGTEGTMFTAQVPRG